MHLVGGFLYMNNLIKKFGGEKRWVNWQYKTVGGKQTKMPLGSSNKPETWSTYDSLPSKNNIGIMFGLDKKFLGVDIDKCIKDGVIEHEKKEEILSFIKEANTYTELSPSKTGVHLYFEITEPLELVSNKKSPYECYSSLRFFTVTGESFGKEKDIATITPERAIELLNLIQYPWGKQKKEEESNISQDVIPMEDEELLRKMFSSKNGDKIKTLYDGEGDEDISKADLSLCSYLAFWTGKNSIQMERIWMSSPLGAREKTTKRKDYRDRTINTAIASCKEVYTNKIKTKIKVDINEDEKEEIDFDFVYTTKGKNTYPALCLENITEVLRKHPAFKQKLRFDDFKGYKEIKENNTWRQFKDIDTIIIQSKISRLFADFQTVSKVMLYDAIDLISEENKVDSAIDYLKSLTWDKKDRIEEWLQNTYGVEDNIYYRAVASNWLKGLVKRLLYPGCKFDYVLVLEGEQGTLKSTSLGILGRNWHIETTMATDTKDFFMQFHGKSIVEFSEGETLSRTEVKRMKAIITTQVDTYRLPYDRITRDHPRRCVFAMTTNSSEYLKDETGNRRWLPVETKLPKANVEWLKENREQLFAEAYYRVEVLKENTHEIPETEASLMQASRRISDPNTELVSDWYYGLSEHSRMNGITVLQVHIEALGNAFNKSMRKGEQMSIASILKDYLNLEKKRVEVKGIQYMKWYPKGIVESTEVLESTETSDKRLLNIDNF